MKIGFYGAGRVGCTLGRYFREHGLNVTGFYSRNPEHAEEAAQLTGTSRYETCESLLDENDVLFLTVSDKAIPVVTKQLTDMGKDLLKGKLLCHTSGAMSSAVFSGTGAFGYSIHPLLAISNRENSYRDLPQAFFTVEGDPEYLQYWLELLSGIGLYVKTISAEEKVRYHAAAVMASNLVCGLYDMAAEELAKCGFTKSEAEQALKGLFLENAKGITKNGVTAQLTGPAERGDAETVRKHLSVIEEDTREAYRLLSEKVLKVAERKNPETDYSAVRETLAEKVCE